MIEFVCNPISGGKRGLKIINKISSRLDELKIEYRIWKTERPKHAIEITKQLCLNGATDIIAVGGDGTINEVLNGINVNTTNFGIIPAGNGNDFIVSSKIPLNPIDALDVIIKGTPKPTDYLDCAGVRGINIIGTGIDVDILKRCAKSKILKGKIQYFISLLISLIKFKFYEFDVIKKNVRQSKEALIICVGNGRQLGGGITMCPNAKIDDGKMDYILINKMKKHSIFGALINLMKGNILHIKESEYSLEENVEVCFDKKTTLQIDGELYDNLPFDVKIIKNGINLYRP